MDRCVSSVDLGSIKGVSEHRFSLEESGGDLLAVVGDVRLW